MLNPEDDIVPPELLEATLALSNQSNKHYVYFDKNTGDILSITNEKSDQFTDFVQFEYEVVKEFLTGAQNLIHYKVEFTSAESSEIVSKFKEDIRPVTLVEVQKTEGWTNELTVENYEVQGMWGFTLGPYSKERLKNTSTELEFYIVSDKNPSLLYRTIKVALSDLIYKERVMVKHAIKAESRGKLRVLTKEFFKSYGYILLK